jgi:hypothetical protein
VTFFYREGYPLQLQVAPVGSGSVKGAAELRGDTAPANGAPLYIGEGYTLTAKPAANWLFANWLENGQIAGTNATLSFIMESNLVVTANFVTNPFVAHSARYDGVFYASDSSVAAWANSGLIENFQLKTNGVFSAKLYLAGTSYSLTGIFNPIGETTETIPRSSEAGGDVTMHLVIPPVLPRQIRGTVQGTNFGGWNSSNLYLYAATTNTNNTAAYTLILSYEVDSLSMPLNYGDAVITNTGAAINLRGVLPDGTPFSRSGPVNEANCFPIYASLYNGQGLMLGQLGISQAIPPTGKASWMKPCLSKGLYTNGFATVLSIIGSP